MIAGYPSTVRHALVGGEHGQQSWCGEALAPNDRAVFINANHALLSKGGEYVLCPDCSEAIRIRLKDVTYERQTRSLMDRPERPGREPHQDGIPYRPQPGVGRPDFPPPTMDMFGK